jgi:hypothetical protein
MNSFLRTLLAAVLLGLLPVLLSACGSDSGSAVTASAAAPTPAATSIVGIAAAGKPLSGKVFLADSSQPSRSVSAPINQDGTFALPLDGLQAPFLLQAVDSQGRALFAFAGSAGMVNINPLSNLALAVASGAADQQALGQVFSAADPARLQTISQAIPAARSDLVTALQPLLSRFGATGSDPFTGYFAPNGQGLDDLFDKVGVSLASGAVTISNSLTGAEILSAPLDAIASAGSLHTAALPAPGAFYLPGNALLTLRVVGALPEGSQIMRSTFTVQLPLGFSLDTGPSGVNSAVPTGSALGANIYPAPALSATDNLVKIGISSVTGFGAGDFLTLRCIASTEALLATNPADFKISVPELYGDLYKNLRLKGLSIVPVALSAAEKISVKQF